MNIYYLDTSALIKRYHREMGTEKVNQLFEEILVRKSDAFISYLGVLEAVSAITRHKKELGSSYSKVMKGVLMEVSENLSIIPIDDEVVTTSMKMVLTHNIRSLDAIHLATAVIIKSYLNKEIIFISSDKELLNAAEIEGFKVLNPEKI